MSVTTMGAAPLIAHTHVCMYCILYWLHYHLDENGAVRNGGHHVVLPTFLPAEKDSMSLMRKLLVLVKSPMRNIPVMTVSFHVIVEKS